MSAFALPVASAGAATCGSPVPYPGDNAAAEEIANWMANGAVALKLPGELPVMAALVESGLKNLNHGDADSLGYFQMREQYWNSGDYAGYPTHPELQLKWFTDQAAKVRFQRTTAGKPDPASQPTLYGEWIADIERPAEQYRGRYQLRLAEARALIAKTCPNLQTGDVTPPRYSARIAKRQHPLRSKAIGFQVLCPEEACNVSATASLSLSNRRRALKLINGETTMLGPGRRKTIKFELSAATRSKIKEALSAGGSAHARLRVKIADAGGVATFKIVKLRLLK